MLVATGTVPLGLWTAYAREFHFSAAVLTFLASSTLFGVLVAVLLFGNLSDRIGRRAVLIPGVLLGARQPRAVRLRERRPDAVRGARHLRARGRALHGRGHRGADRARAAGRRHAPRRDARGDDVDRRLRDGAADRRHLRAVRAVPAQARLRRLPRPSPAPARRRLLPAGDGAQPPAVQDPAAQGRRSARGQVDLRPRVARRLLLLLRRLLLPVARADGRDRDPRRLEPAPRRRWSPSASSARRRSRRSACEGGRSGPRRCPASSCCRRASRSSCRAADGQPGVLRRRRARSAASARASPTSAASRSSRRWRRRTSAARSSRST